MEKHYYFIVAPTTTFDIRKAPLTDLELRCDHALLITSRYPDGKFCSGETVECLGNARYGYAFDSWAVARAKVSYALEMEEQWLEKKLERVRQTKALLEELNTEAEYFEYRKREAEDLAERIAKLRVE